MVLGITLHTNTKLAHHVCRELVFVVPVEREYPHTHVWRHMPHIAVMCSKRHLARSYLSVSTTPPAVPKTPKQDLTHILVAFGSKRPHT